MIRKRWVLLSMFTALLLVAAVTAPVVADDGKDEARGQEKHGKEKHGKDKRGPKVHDWDDRRYDPYFERHGYTHLDIPPGHLPPPGECRVWSPGKPPGHQPPPGPCERLRYRVPAGAWLIQRPSDKPEHVDVSVYDSHRPGIVITIGIFAVDTGAFIRQMSPR